MLEWREDRRVSGDPLEANSIFFVLGYSEFYWLPIRARNRVIPGSVKRNFEHLFKTNIIIFPVLTIPEMP